MNTEVLDSIIESFTEAMRPAPICQWRFDRLGGVEPTPEQVAFTEALEAGAESDR